MNEIYYITPIFSFEFNDEQCIQRVFEHNYRSGDIQYYISFKKTLSLDIIPPPLSQRLDRRTKDLLDEIGKSALGQTLRCAEYYLVITAKSQNIINFDVNIINALLDSFRLHTTNGILYDSTLRVNFNDDVVETQLYSRLPKQDSGRTLAVESYLLTNEFDNCKKSFEILIRKKYKRNKTFNNILKIALNYHRIIFQLWCSPTQFLLLMIIFEALFKKGGDSKISDPAEILAKLIEKDKTKQRKIITNFYNKKRKKKKNGKNTKDTSSFRGIRNIIAHGDPALSDKRVMARYRLLYEYIRKAIIEVLHISDEEIGAKDDYYDKIKVIATKRCGNYNS